MHADAPETKRVCKTCRFVFQAFDQSWIRHSPNREGFKHPFSPFIETFPLPVGRHYQYIQTVKDDELVSQSSASLQATIDLTDFTNTVNQWLADRNLHPRFIETIRPITYEEREPTNTFNESRLLWKTDQVQIEMYHYANSNRADVFVHVSNNGGLPGELKEVFPDAEVDDQPSISVKKILALSGGSFCNHDHGEDYVLRKGKNGSVEKHVIDSVNLLKFRLEEEEDFKLIGGDILVRVPPRILRL